MKLFNSIFLILLWAGSHTAVSGQGLYNLQTRNVNQTESIPFIEYDSQNNIIMGLDRTTVLPGSGITFPSNIWLEKWDQNGNLKWTLSSNITNNQYDSQFIDMAVDQQDNIYLAGIYLGPDFTLDGHTIHGFSNNGIDLFIAKVSKAGNVLWLQGVDTAFSHPSRRSLNGISVTPEGTLLISGQQMRDFRFGGATFKGDSTVPFMNNSENPVTFYAKMNGDGQVIWHHRILNRHSGQFNGRNSLHEMYAAEDGSIYATFGADSALIFENDTITSPQPTSYADRAGILKLNAQGDLQSWKFLISPTYLLSKMRLDNCGNPVLSGYYSTSMSIGTQQINANARFDIFVAKLDTSLNTTWLKSHGSDDGHLGTGMAINDRNEVFLAYDFWGELSYNGQNFIPSSVEVAIVKLDSAGNYMWHNYTEGAGATIQARNLAVSPNNKLTMVAHYNGTKSIDNQSVSNGSTLDLMLATFNDTTHPGTSAGCVSGNTIGKEEHFLSENLKVYPNPATNQLQVDLGQKLSGNAQQLKVYNLQQQVVLQTEVTGSKTSIDISSLSSGVYLLYVEGSHEHIKFVKR